MQTKTSETPCILVMSGDPLLVSTAVDVLRSAGRNAVGTSDPWEAILLASQRTIDLIVRDQDLSGLGSDDFCFLLSEDPVLKDVPTVLLPADGVGGQLLQQDLLAAVDHTFNPRFPSEVPTGRDTRFIRRRRPASVPVPAAVATR
ncbi:MAG TPA: hypothetical protein VE981_13050 [Planctomycetota bacterium]|nr:hypothetical protein [Planctomycetota bacterium]